MLTVENRKQLLDKAQALLNARPFSKQNQGEFESILKLVDVIDADSRHTRAAEVVKELRTEEKETRAAREQMAFASYMHGGEKRTYAALETGSVPGSVIVPFGQWRRDYLARLVSASGWLRANASVVPTQTGRNLINFVADDSANVASILADNQTLPSANPNYAAPTAQAKSFATSLLTSFQFADDVDGGSFDLSAHLADVFGRRVARKFNTDTTTTLLPLLNFVTAASSTLPTYNELVDMQAAINAEYFDSDSAPCYMMSKALRNLLLKTLTTSGNPMYPEIKSNQLLGLPLVINADMVATSGSVAVVAGSIKRSVVVQDAGAVLVRSAERYIEQGQIFWGFVSRLGVKLVDSNAVSALKLA